jgi:hypothetical protein
LLALFIGSPAALWYFLARERRGVSLEVDSRSMQFPGGSRGLPLNYILGVEPRGEKSVFLQLEDRATLELTLEKNQLGELLDALRFDPNNRVTRAMFKPQLLSSSAIGLVIAFIGPVLLIPLTMPLTPSEHSGTVMLLCVGICFLAALLFGARYGARRVEVSREGLRLVLWNQERYIPSAEVMHFEECWSERQNPEDRSETIREFKGIKISLRSGSLLTLSEVGEEDRRPVMQALHRMKEPAFDEKLLEKRKELSRGGQELKAWLTSLQERHERATTYREARLSEDELEACLQDASAPPDLRLGAAVALGASGKGAKEKLRVAAERCENPALARAIEAVRDDRLDEVLVAAVERQTGGR